VGQLDGSIAKATASIDYLIARRYWQTRKDCLAMERLRMNFGTSASFQKSMY
jgi:hypothetical protein